MKKRLLFLALAICLVIAAAVTVSGASGTSASNETTNQGAGAVIAHNPETVLEDGSVQTVYGTIPADKADAATYPIAVFMNGVFKGADSVFASSNGGAFQVAKDLMDNNSERNNVVQIYLRANVQVKARHSNTGQMSGTLIVDLNGYTLSSNNYMIYNAEGKKYDEIYPLRVLTMNGCIDIQKAPLLKADAYGEGYADLTAAVKTMKFDFENIKFKRTIGDSTSGFLAKYQDSISSGKKTDLYASFEHCEFDFTGAPAGMVIFNALDPDITKSHNEFKVTVKGCVFRMNDVNDYTWYNVNEADNSSVKFTADSDGNNTTLILPANASEPTAKIPYGADEKAFVKVGETAEGKIYEAGVYTPSDFGLKVKTSLTLDSRVVLNVYVTKDAVNSFSLNGETYTDLSAYEVVTVGSESYYHIALPMAAAEMGESVVFVVNAENYDLKDSFTYTLSIPKYASHIFKDANASANTKLLAADILSYAKAGATYFGGADTSTIDAVLNPDHNLMSIPATVPVMVGAAVGIEEATLVLGDKPAIRFYLPDNANPDSYAFFIGKNKIKTVYNAEENYIETDVFAYALAEEITYTVNGEAGGSYGVANYYYHAKNVLADANLTALTERFIKYLESAKIYRLEALGDASAKHEHSLITREYEMTANNPAYTESVCACTYRERTLHTGLNFGDERVSVYFLGNSYTSYNSMSSIFGAIASSMGIDVEVLRRTKGSWHLWQFQNPNDEGGVGFHADLEAYDFDYAILQDGSTQTLSAIAEFYDGVRLVGELVENDGAEVILYQTWGRKAGHSVLDTYNLTTDSMARTVAAAYEAIARETGYTNSPAGSAFLDVYTNHPEIELYDPDLTHPSATGSYLVALCHYATLFGRSPIGVKYTADLDEETALILQTAAYNAVFGESIVTDEYKTSSEGIHVMQAENNLFELPEGSTLISAGITGDNGKTAYATTVAKANTITDEQKKEFSNIAYGVSIIGNKNMVTSLTRATDGAWISQASNRLSFDFDGNNYDISGDMDMHEPYKALITYNFGGIVNITAIGYMSGNMDGFAQAQDVYISNDGISWTCVRSGCYDAVLLDKSNGSLHSLDTFPTDKEGGVPGVCVVFDMNSAEGGVWAKYVRFGIKEGVVVANKSYDLNTLELAVWGRADNSYLSEIPEGSELLSDGLTSSSEFSAKADGAYVELTAEQKADLADMSKYGMSVIGFKTLEREIGYACDGIWYNTQRLAGVFYDEGDTIKRYDINGNESADGKYECLITYNFGEKVTIDAIGYMSGDMNGFAQVQDVWVSDDGVNWIKVTTACYDRTSGDTQESVTDKPKDSTGHTSGVSVMFDMGGVRAQYVRVGIVDGMSDSKYPTRDINTLELAVYGKKD